MATLRGSDMSQDCPATVITCFYFLNKGPFLFPVPTDVLTDQQGCGLHPTSGPVATDASEVRSLCTFLLKPASHLPARLGLPVRNNCTEAGQVQSAAVQESFPDPSLCFLTSLILVSLLSCSESSPCKATVGNCFPINATDPYEPHQMRPLDRPSFSSAIGSLNFSYSLAQSFNFSPRVSSL